MIHLMGYDKDNDVYDELNKGDKPSMESLAKRVMEKHKVTELISSCGDPYDWFELWDDEDEDYVKYITSENLEEDI